MFELLAFRSLRQRFDCEVFAVFRHMRHSRWQDTSSCNLASGAIWHVISIPAELTWEDFLQEKRKRRNRVTCQLQSFSDRCAWRPGGQVPEHFGRTWL
jgi:hypothetical protein